MQRGYFDDFGDFRKNKGKVWVAPERLAPAAHAQPFPQLAVVQSDGSPATFPPAASDCSSGGGSSGNDGAAGGGEQPPVAAATVTSTQQPAAASLVCLAFRAGAQPMLEAWATPFSQQFQGRAGVALIELAVVEGVVMRLWPFKQLLLRSSAAAAGKYAMPCRHLHHFGDMQALREALHLTNLLTGCASCRPLDAGSCSRPACLLFCCPPHSLPCPRSYVFLVDSRGRLRWRGSGSPSGGELATLLSCTEELLLEGRR